jgi:hypothetical protein
MAVHLEHHCVGHGACFVRSQGRQGLNLPNRRVWCREEEDVREKEEEEEEGSELTDNDLNLDTILEPPTPLGSISDRLRNVLHTDTKT